MPPWHWLFFCPVPKFCTHFGRPETKSLKSPKRNWLILVQMDALVHFINILKYFISFYYLAICISNIIIKGANRYQKMVHQNGRGKEFQGLSDNYYKEPTFERVFFSKTVDFCRPRKSGSAYALVDLISLVPLIIMYIIFIVYVSIYALTSLHTFYP